MWRPRRQDRPTCSWPTCPTSPAPLVPDLPVAASYEPAGALDGGADGLDLIRRLLPDLPAVLAPAGAAMLEIGGDQDELMAMIVSELLPDWSCTIHPDLSGSPRVAELVRAHD